MEPFGLRQLIIACRSWSRLEMDSWRNWRAAGDVGVVHSVSFECPSQYYLEIGPWVCMEIGMERDEARK